MGKPKKGINHKAYNVRLPKNKIKQNKFKT